MKSIKVKIIDPIGLHARPASKVTAEATKFKDCEITVILDGKQVNAKSIISLMSLAVKYNNKIEIQAKGVNEDEALASIEKVLRENKIIE